MTLLQSALFFIYIIKKALLIFAVCPCRDQPFPTDYKLDDNHQTACLGLELKEVHTMPNASLTSLHFLF